MYFTQMRRISRVVVEFCANSCFRKFAFCGRRFQDTTKSIFNYVTGRNEDWAL